MDAQTLFAPLGPRYDRYASLLSFGQDPRWRRFMVSRIDAGPGDRVLDVATGTAAVALELVRQKGCTVVGVDQSEGMLETARQRVNGRIELVRASAESLPFADGEFDALTFTYLLRYVDDPAATHAARGRRGRPGGARGAREFALPHGLARPAWELWVRAGLPAAGVVIGHGWHEVGSFLGPSIRGFYAEWPEPRLLDAWRAAGIADARTRRMSLGGGIVTWGRKT